MVEVKEGMMPFRGYETYYRIVNPSGKKAPVLFLHGGPGSTHNYFEGFDAMAEKLDRPFVMYDQIGCGKSMVKGHRELFTADVWLDELEALREHLHLDEVHILGQSWGGMMCIWYAIERKPAGVLSYILSSTLPAAWVWKKEQYRRISYLPEEDQKAIRDAIENENFDDPRYLELVDQFMLKYCCGPVTEDAPEYLRRKKPDASEAYITGWGQNEFTPTGTLSGYDFTDRLHEIEEPCLITSGAMDLCSPYIAKMMADRIPNARWELFEYSRHMPFVDETEEYMAVFEDWFRSLA